MEQEQAIQQDILAKLTSGKFLFSFNNQEESGYYCYLNGSFMAVSEGVNGYAVRLFLEGQDLLRALWLSYGTTYLLKGKLYRTVQNDPASRLVAWQLIQVRLAALTDYSRNRLAKLYADAQPNHTL